MKLTPEDREIKNIKKRQKTVLNRGNRQSRIMNQEDIDKIDSCFYRDEYDIIQHDKDKLNSILKQISQNTKETCKRELTKLIEDKYYYLINKKEMLIDIKKVIDKTEP